MKRLLVIFTCILFLISFSGCSNKKGVTPDEFKQIMIEEDFYVNDDTKITGDTISKIIYADNKKYQVEYYVFKNEKYANKAFKSNKKMIQNYKKKTSKEKMKTKNDYEYYSLDNNETYFSVSVSGKTLIYCQANNKYKKEINSIFKKLNY